MKTVLLAVCNAVKSPIRAILCHLKNDEDGPKTSADIQPGADYPVRIWVEEFGVGSPSAVPIK